MGGPRWCRLCGQGTEPRLTAAASSRAGRPLEALIHAPPLQPGSPSLTPRTQGAIFSVPETCGHKRRQPGIGEGAAGASRSAVGQHQMGPVPSQR